MSIKITTTASRFREAYLEGEWRTPAQIAEKKRYLLKDVLGGIKEIDIDHPLSGVFEEYQTANYFREQIKALRAALVSIWPDEADHIIQLCADFADGAVEPRMDAAENLDKTANNFENWLASKSGTARVAVIPCTCFKGIFERVPVREG